MNGSNVEAGASSPIPLHLLTTEIVLADLVSGRPITSDQGHTLVLTSSPARGVLNWYRGAQRKWAGNVQAADCEALISAVLSPPVTVAPPNSAKTINSGTLRLVKIVAHHFAGLHGFVAPGQYAADFVFEPSRPITLFEGVNGSGKTSLLNAVVWCLTGKLYRPQRLPEAANADYTIEVERGAAAEVTQHTISPVTPLPTNGWLPEGTTKAVPTDTWVELTFARQDGTLLPPIRRRQTRTSRGKLEEHAFSASDLGVDPIALSLGTTMPGLLAHLQIGDPSELSMALARLTGLSDLVDLARHASRAKFKIEKEIRKSRTTAVAATEAAFQQHRLDLEERISEFPAMRPSSSLPEISDPVEEFIELKRHFEARNEQALADARSVLGKSFDAGDADHRKGLNADIAPAIQQIKALAELPSMSRLRKLQITPDERLSVQSLLDRLFTEARELEILASEPVLARRTRLYARVADWMRTHEHEESDQCAVCAHSLSDAIDSATGRRVADHLQEATIENTFLQETLETWAERWTARLALDLPAGLAREVTRDLPADPGKLLRQAMSTELFNTEPFSGVLGALRSDADRLIDCATDALPTFTEPETKHLPDRVGAAAAKLHVMLADLQRALAFSDWLSINRSVLLAALTNIRGGVERDSERVAGLSGLLARLQQIVDGARPISAAQELVSRMDHTRKTWVEQSAAVENCTVAANALAEIIPVGKLATDQIQHLQSRLQRQAEHWRNAIYQAATTHTPAPIRTDILPGGAIQFRVGRDGVSAPAQHVSNASALRALLMGFYLALREHILKTRGGLDLIVLDDPQDLFDFNNRSKLSSALQGLAKKGGQILATTHDRNFALTLVAEARSSDLIEHRSIHPVNTSRLKLETSLAVDELDRKRKAYRDNVDSAVHARDYACEARTFLESRLGDLFDDPAYPAFSCPSDAPTLMTHVDRLKRLVSDKSNELFRSPVVTALAKDPAWEPAAEERRVLNKAHHAEAHNITYPEVQAVDAGLKRLRTATERAHEEFRRFRQREPLQDVEPDNIVPLTPISQRVITVPMVPDLAAFSRAMPMGGSQETEVEELSSDWFADKALYYIRHDTLGMAVPSGSVAIVEIMPSLPPDNQLVIARMKSQTFARRLLRAAHAETFSLASEALVVRGRRPTLAVNPHKCQIHRVVGVLFGQDPPPTGREEAEHVTDHSALRAIELAYRVREESAVPRVFPDQVVLVGRQLQPDEIDMKIGRMAAITLEDGDSILKRIGTSISGEMPQLRHYETIGGMGSSAVLATERLPGAAGCPVIVSVREVIGVLFEV